MGKPELPELLVPDASAWRVWLEENHATSPGVRIVLHKTEGRTTELSYEHAVQEALCFGWIDGQASRRDEKTWRVRMTPRRSRSNWSKSNVERVALLESQGRMTEAGRAQVASAKAGGRWPG